jgi:glycosyltransferase involved in cell wall biosynthesis
MAEVLYDGWELIHQPNGPAALHLLALLALHPPQAGLSLALPAAPPEWLEGQAGLRLAPTGGGPGGRLAWEQAVLPRLARQAGADTLHLLAPAAPLFGGPRVVVSPAEYAHGGQPPGGRGFLERLRQSAGRGGLEGRAHWLLPTDLPVEAVDGPDGPAQVHRLPPALHPAFASPSTHLPAELELPEVFVLYHGPGTEADLQRLLGAWSWAAGPVGQAYPLVALGLDEAGRKRLEGLAGEYDLAKTVIALPQLLPEHIPAVYRRSVAVFHPAQTATWGGSLRTALACGKPLVAAATTMAEAIAGPAAYLAGLDDGRALGAALITVLVEEDVAGRLAQAGRERAAGWGSERFSGELARIYSDAAG